MHYFTADPHFNHDNIIRYNNRPFDTVAAMNNTIISNINSTVDKQDVLWILGDIYLGGSVEVVAFLLSNINCTIKIVPGGHDWRWLHNLGTGTLYSKTRAPVEIMPPLVDTKIDGYHVTLCHYPIENWEKKHYGAVHFHGHSHGKSSIMANRYDVGVDEWDFTPVGVNIIRKKRTHKHVTVPVLELVVANEQRQKSFISSLIDKIG